MCILVALYLLFFIAGDNAFAQTRLILNGGRIMLNGGVYLVIDNSASNAITRTSGHIISEGENNILKWIIGTTTGTYTVPWGNGASDYIPITFSKTAGAGAGSFLFSTYNTPALNSSQLPTDVTNFIGASGSDKSLFATDRFWQVNAQGYSTKPSLSNVIFTYLDSEFAGANITSVESSLKAHRWNTILSTWVDYAPSTITDVTANTVTVSSIDDTNFYPWWVVNYINDRHWVASTSSTGSIASDWSYTPGGANGAAVPITLDDVSFDGNSISNMTLNNNMVANKLIVKGGFTGIISQGLNTITTSDEAILSGGTFMGGSGALTVNGLFTISGTSFTSTSGTLDLKKNFIFTSGTFVHNNGTVRFSGTTGRQDISGNSVSIFNNIIVTNTSASPGVSIQSNQDLNGILSLGSNVVFDADGSSNTSVFKLISSADSPTQDAAIDILPSGAQVSGNVTVQRYMSIEGANGGRIYRYISSPIQNASVADIQQEIAVTGSFTGTSICSGCSTGQSLYEYDETVITDTSLNGIADLEDGYFDFPSTVNTETFVAGKGYALFVRGNLLSTALWDVRGPINSGNVSSVTLPTAFTSSGTIANDGWSLVGNPFPSTIDWNAASGWTKTNIEASVYFRDNGSLITQVSSWNGVTNTNGGSRYIPAGQGFWVKTNAASPNLQATENVKAAGTQSTFFRENAVQDLVRITMVKGSLRDETVIHYREDATDDFDSQADAWKLANSIFNLSSILSNGNNLAINSLPAFSCNKIVHLNISNASVTSYSLKFSEYESFPENIAITLHDNFANTNFDVRSGGSYSFSVTSNAASAGPTRFDLIFDAAPASSDFLLSTTTANICEGAEALVRISATESSATYVAELGNSVISIPVPGNGEGITIPIQGSKLTVGENIITIKATSENCSSAIQKTITINKESVPIAAFVQSGKSCGEGEIVLKAKGAPENGFYNWYESVSDEFPMDNQKDSILTIASLLKSKTYYVSIVNGFGCEGLRTPVLAEIVQFTNAKIEENGDSLVSNYTAGNQWYFENTIIVGATKQSINVQNSGLYTVKIDVDGCNTSADYQLVINGGEKLTDLMVTAFPNPVMDEVEVKIPASRSDIKSLRILNALGMTMTAVPLEPGSENRTSKIDMKHYPAGVYILQVIGTVGEMEIKLLKQ